MPSSQIDVNFRADIFGLVLRKEAATEIATSIQNSNGNIGGSIEALDSKVKPKQRAQTILANSVADVANENASHVKALVIDHKVESLRQVATGFSVDGLAKVVDPTGRLRTPPGNTPGDGAKSVAKFVENRLFSGHRQRLARTVPMQQFVEHQDAFGARISNLHLTTSDS